VLAVALPTLVPIAGGAIGMRAHMAEGGHPLQTLLWFVWFGYMAALAVVGVVLFQTTNAASISEMVAQRWNRSSYLALLLIASVASYTSCFILAAHIFRIAVYPDREPVIWQVCAPTKPLPRASHRAASPHGLAGCRGSSRARALTRFAAVVCRRDFFR
jgi:hypothetical protein